MKKLIASILVAAVFSIFSPVAPLAHAGSIDNQLTKIISQDVSVAQIQQLLTIKKQLQQGDKQGLVDALTELAVNQSGQSEVENIATAVSQGNISQVAENALRQQVEKSVTNRIAPYEKQLGAISTLFNN